ncbi:Momilactone A synthase [Acorus calamus]|uniref:Momilactone A synthase n=1 Tax=Acorus calamus TaxID=4465 RepID=A0AAV9CFF8_ACOCL|nr:Momilactone A synthase [Acorus calamus]
MQRLEGKVALITGGASGIGECTARLFHAHGAKLVIADIQDDLGKSISDQLGGPSECLYMHCDVTSEPDVEQAVDAAVSAFGTLDIMYNNAGRIDVPKPITETSQNDFERVVSTNLTGAFLGTKHAARVMVPRARGGCIVSTASVCAVVGGTGTHAYTASKHALLGLMKSAAFELGRHGIRVNLVSPYAVATPLAKGFGNLSDEEFDGFAMGCGNLKGVALKAEDVARAVLYLASDDAKYVSGHNLLVDGGFSVVNPSLSVVEQK